MSALRVRLRRLEASDAEAITGLLESDYDGVMQTARIPWPFTRTEAETFIARVTSGGEDANAIIVADTGEFAGVIGTNLGEEIEIGYWIGKPYRGRGLASAAVDAVLERSRAGRVRRVCAQVFPANEASARVLVKNGFRREGERAEDLPLRGGRRTLHIYVRELG